MRWLNQLPLLPPYVRSLIVVVLHLTLFSAAYISAFLIRFDGNIPESWINTMWVSFPIVLIVKVVVFAALQMFQGWWKYVSLSDVVSLSKALALGTFGFLAVNVFIIGDAFPRSIYILDFGISLFLLGGARGSLRILREAARNIGGTQQKSINLLILGAGDTGETLSREIAKNPNLPYRVIGFLDDDKRKRGLRIHGIPVLGVLGDTKAIVEAHDVKQIIIAMPSATREQTRKIVELTKLARVDTKILPAVESILSGHVSLNQLREVSISDLLGREPVKLDMQSIGRFIEGRRILVTGAGGSIGSEICRQVLRFNPEQLIMVERGETPLFFIHRELRSAYEELIVPYIANVASRPAMERIFRKHKPDVVIHAAAYKHVPLMEMHPSEAVLNNVLGTKTVADVSGEFGVESFVLISTDKAVNPTSVMGATKRITELYVLSKDKKVETDFCAVRFGNVLGSNGSVVPIFREQIRSGGPVTVTHPEMTRYFMTIPEASQLVLQAAAFGQSGEVYILDMGEPVKISDLARDMIRLSGASEDDIEIVYSGVRPGEKLFEELTLDDEKVDTTRHKKIFIGRNADTEIQLLENYFEELVEAANEADGSAIRDALKKIIPVYRHEPSDKIVPIERGRDLG